MPDAIDCLLKRLSASDHEVRLLITAAPARAQGLPPGNLFYSDLLILSADLIARRPVAPEKNCMVGWRYLAR
jgi:hypothetical protein